MNQANAMIPVGARIRTSPAVFRAAAEYFGFSLAHLRSKARDPYTVLARFAAIYIMIEDLGLGCTEVGRQVGRDHSTVLHGYSKAKELLVSDKVFEETIADVREIAFGGDAPAKEPAPVPGPQDALRKRCILESVSAFYRIPVSALKRSTDGDGRATEAQGVAIYVLGSLAEMSNEEIRATLGQSVSEGRVISARKVVGMALARPGGTFRLTHDTIMADYQSRMRRSLQIAGVLSSPPSTRPLRESLAARAS